MGKKKAKFTFEESFQRLEEIVSALEESAESLEDSLGLFEEGMKLSDSLRTKLKDAEQRIQVLVKSSKGGFELEDENENS